MEFNLEFHLQNEISFSFDNNECDMVDLLDGEPLLVYATISLGDETKIGALSGYLLYNDMDFFYKCDAVSGDCETIAGAICKKDGSVKAKYISKCNGYDKIFILDNIEIEESQRKRGVATAVIENLPRILQKQFDDAGSTIFLCASDYIAAKQYGFDSPQYEECSRKLMDFYKRFGYEMISENVMVWKK